MTKSKQAGSLSSFNRGQLINSNGESLPYKMVDKVTVGEGKRTFSGSIKSSNNFKGNQSFENYVEDLSGGHFMKENHGRACSSLGNFRSTNNPSQTNLRKKATIPYAIAACQGSTSIHPIPVEIPIKILDMSKVDAKIGKRNPRSPSKSSSSHNLASPRPFQHTRRSRKAT